MLINLSKSLLVLSTISFLTACGGESSSSDTSPAVDKTPPKVTSTNLDSLVRTVQVTNKQCPSGGIEIEMGIDTNSNGKLDTNEIDKSRTKTVCHGTNGFNGQNGLSSLISITEASIKECPKGGKKVLIGIDVNRDKILTSDEVQETNYICSDNGGIGKFEDLLLNAIDEPFGNNCLHGGHKHQIGLDKNNNALLEEGEVLSYSFLCNPNIAPSITFLSHQLAVSGHQYKLSIETYDFDDFTKENDKTKLEVVEKPNWLQVIHRSDSRIVLQGIASGHVGDTFTVKASSTDSDLTTEKEFIITINKGTSSIFSVIQGILPVAIDLLFAAAPTTDGTAKTDDTTPPVTTAINDLAGFSATATIDLTFSAALDASSVVAGSSVWLVELKSKEDNSLIDPLDLNSIVAVAPTAPFSEGEDQLIPGKDYVAEYVEMDNGATPSIRIHPLKPLDPKTKYIVIVTDKLKDANGVAVVPSSEYKHVSGNDALASSALAPVRTAIQGWEKLAGGFLATITSAAQTQKNVILSYAFTTEANDDILLAMAAPENYISNLLKDTKTLEGLLGTDKVAGIVAQIGTATSKPFATDAEKLAIRNTDTYKDAVTAAVAKSIIDGGAAKVAGAKVAAMDATTIGGINAWNANAANADKQISLDPTKWDAAQRGYISLLSGTYTASTTTAVLSATAANGAGALLKTAAARPASRPFTVIAGGSGIVKVPNTKLGLPNATDSVQGMLTLPQFMLPNDATNTASFSSYWTGSTEVGKVIDGAFGNAEGTTPPKDSDDTLNVTYRFPFAEKVADAKVPVLITYPTDGACPKPAAGWKTVIFQHGITTDRTASLGFANAMAKAPGCLATVAMDLPTHGVDASSTDRNGTAVRYKAFDGFNVAGYVSAADPTTTPFAATLAGLKAASNTTFDGLQERHGNVALDAAQKPVPMSFVVGEESGNSGDFQINLTDMRVTRDNLRQAVMDMLNLNASLGSMDIDGNTGNTDFDVANVFFAGHSLGAITGLTYVAVNNSVANNTSIAVKEVNPIKATVLANPGAQLPKLLENSPSFSKRILPGLATKGLTQGTANLEKFFGVFQAPLDSVDPINFTTLLKATNTPTLMFEMVGGGQVAATDKNTVAANGPVTGLSDEFITAATSAALAYPADTVVPNNANPALNSVATGKSYLAGTDPLIKQLDLATVTATIAPSATKLMVVSKLKQGTHGTMSSADAITVFTEMMTQTGMFFATGGTGITVLDAARLNTAD